MEWVGWFIEYKIKEILFDNYGGSKGPRYGNTEFDYMNMIPWDFKAHIENSSGHPWTILNDCEAVDLCIEEYGGLGYFFVCGDAEFDEDESFKHWHDNLKGKTSDYVKERIKRGAKSRIRKKAFNVESFSAIFINDKILREGLRHKWIGYFQKGMRNANGTPRRAKYKINICKAPLFSLNNMKIDDYFR